jgi:hypothetical protein
MSGRIAVARLAGIDSYFVGFNWARRLRPLAVTEDERDAVSRLVDFRGSADDVLKCAALLESAGRHSDANELRMLLK